MQSPRLPLAEYIERVKGRSDAPPSNHYTPHLVNGPPLFSTLLERQDWVRQHFSAKHYQVRHTRAGRQAVDELSRHADRETCRQAGVKVDRQRDRETERHRDRETERSAAVQHADGEAGLGQQALLRQALPVTSPDTHKQENTGRRVARGRQATGSTRTGKPNRRRTDSRTHSD